MTGMAKIRSRGAAGGCDPARIAVIIPAWQPNEQLPALVAALRRAGVRHLIVVDDGSSPACEPIFADLARTEGVHLCRHNENRGKGRALKTAFEDALRTYPRLTGVVTADADGQHLPEDILRVAGELVGAPGGAPDGAVLGVRAFTGPVPFRSRMGNALTRQIFHLLTGHWVRDTQTGLRGLPLSVLPELLDLPGERYEFEMAMLAHLCRAAGAPHEIPIETVYLEDNRGSHFDPLRDSLRVYRALFRAGRQPRIGKGHRAGKTEKPRLRTA